MHSPLCFQYKGNYYVVCLKSLVNGTRKQTKQKIKNKLTLLAFKVIAILPKEAFADSFQKVYERCQQCVVKDGDYFEGQ
jgi:hypothetical protein